jgi:hypothetical protein
MYVHALHTVHALPELHVAGGRLGDGVSSDRPYVIMQNSLFVPIITLVCGKEFMTPGNFKDCGKRERFGGSVSERWVIWARRTPAIQTCRCEIDFAFD